MKWLKNLFYKLFNKVEPRENSKGEQVLDVPQIDPAPVSNKNYKNADKLKCPIAKRFIQDPTTSSEKITPKFVVLHHTVSYTTEATIKLFKDKNVSVHYLVAKDGEIIQMADNNRKCWHAGSSEWKGVSGLNSHSIGIEIINMGPLSKKGDKFYDYYNKLYTGPVHVRKGLGYEYWEAITQQQEKAVLELCKYLNEALDIPYDNFIGHYECAPKRKNDPYGLFTMGEMNAVRAHLKKG